MSLSLQDRTYLRDLASRVAEIAADPYNDERRRMWYRHNDLKPERPMVLIYPEGSWSELLTTNDMRLQDPLWNGLEWWLRHVIYRWEHLRDDNVIEPVLELPPTHRGNTGYGLVAGMSKRTYDRGAASYAPVICDPDDIEKLTRPHLVVDHAKKTELWESAQDVFGDILEVRWKRSPGVDTSLVNHVCHLRGLEQVMVDMVERPKWLHRLFTFMMETSQTLLDELERSGELELMKKSPDYAGSGGTCYTHDLPAPNYDGTPRLKDTWGFAESQEYTLVSPRMYEEFGLRYQVPLLERFGLNCYGCCENMTDKLDTILASVPRLRRLSISPWTDVHVAAEKLGNRCVFSWKPDPTCVVFPYDADAIRRTIRDTLDATRGCVVEMILKDTHTCNNRPERMTEWVRIATEEAERFASVDARPTV